jgi:hypothetical protein
MRQTGTKFTDDGRCHGRRPDENIRTGVIEEEVRNGSGTTGIDRKNDDGSGKRFQLSTRR